MAPLWEGRRVLVCLGTGGVGKTTMAAALALAAAASGRRTLVMTIDPARRLGQALGLADAGGAVHRVDPAALAAHGVTLTGGSLDALMPEVRGTFDALVERWAPTPAAAASIRANPIYQHFASSLAGSHEYAAVETLYEMHGRGAYDLIVLDTPPARQALDFLAAPRRIIDFLDSDALQWLGRPGRLAGKLSLRLLDVGSTLLVRTLGRLAGLDTLRDLAAFVRGFEGMYDGFAARSRAVEALLHAPEVGYVLVSAPDPLAQLGRQQLQAELDGAGIVPCGHIVNRLAPPLHGGATAGDDAQDAALRQRAAACLAPLAAAEREAGLRAVDDVLAGAARERAALAALRAEGDGSVPVLQVHELPEQAHDLGSLARLRATLAGPDVRSP